MAMLHVQQVADHVEVEDAEDCALDGGGRVLFSICGRLLGLVPQSSSGTSRVQAEETDPDIRGQRGVYCMGQQRNITGIFQWKRHFFPAKNTASVRRPKKS